MAQKVCFQRTENDRVAEIVHQRAETMRRPSVFHGMRARIKASRQPPRFVLLSLCILENVLGSHTGRGLLAPLLAMMSGSMAKNRKGGASLSRYLSWDEVHCVEADPVLKSEQFHRLLWNIQVAADSLRKLCTVVRMH